MVTGHGVMFAPDGKPDLQELPLLGRESRRCLPCGGGVPPGYLGMDEQAPGVFTVWPRRGLPVKGISLQIAGKDTNSGSNPLVAFLAAGLVRLPTRALDAEAAQRALELGYTFLYAFEVLTGEREEPHPRARHDRGRPLAGQEK